MTIEFLKPYGVYTPGAVTDAVPSGVCDVLIRRKVAREVAPPDPPPPQKGRPRGKASPPAGE